DPRTPAVISALREAQERRRRVARAKTKFVRRRGKLLDFEAVVDFFRQRQGLQIARHIGLHSNGARWIGCGGFGEQGRGIEAVMPVGYPRIAARRDWTWRGETHAAEAVVMPQRQGSTAQWKPGRGAKTRNTGKILVAKNILDSHQRQPGRTLDR